MIDIEKMPGEGDTEDLADELRTLGYRVQGIGRVQLTEAVGEPLQVLLWVSDHLGEDVLSALVGAVIVWTRSRFRGRANSPREVRIILDSNGEVLRRIGPLAIDSHLDRELHPDVGGIVPVLFDQAASPALPNVLLRLVRAEDAGDEAPELPAGTSWTTLLPGSLMARC